MANFQLIFLTCLAASLPFLLNVDRLYAIFFALYLQQYRGENFVGEKQLKQAAEKLLKNFDNLHKTFTSRVTLGESWQSPSSLLLLNPWIFGAAAAEAFIPYKSQCNHKSLLAHKLQ